MSSCSVAHCLIDRCLAGLKTRTSVRSLRVVPLLFGLCVTSAAQGATITVHPEDNYGRIFVDIAGTITIADISALLITLSTFQAKKFMCR
jgi:hypothetical protein